MRYRRQCHRSGASRFDVAIAPGLEVAGLGDDVAQAADRGLAMVQSIASSPMGNVLPPGTRELATTMRKALRAAGDGTLRELMGSLNTKARRHVASFLSKVFR